MSLRDSFKAGAKAVVEALGDVAVSSNYLALATTSYDASAGTPSNSYATSAGVSVVFSVFRLVEVDGELVKPEDKRALIAAKSISGVTPSVNDRIVHDGQTWDVQRVESDPAEALWTLQVRRP